jgi:hypothetical protein
MVGGATTRGWNKEWFIVVNKAPCILSCTGYASEYKACWEELPTAEEMEQVEALLGDLAKLKDAKLTGSMVALSFCKWLM